MVRRNICRLGVLQEAQYSNSKLPHATCHMPEHHTLGTVRHGRQNGWFRNRTRISACGRTPPPCIQESWRCARLLRATITEPRRTLWFFQSFPPSTVAACFNSRARAAHVQVFAGNRPEPGIAAINQQDRRYLCETGFAPQPLTMQQHLLPMTSMTANAPTPSDAMK